MGDGKRHLVIGFMSGTSADGVDAALLETDGEAEIRALAFADRPYNDAERGLIRAASQRALEMQAPGTDPLIAEAEAILTHAHADLLARLPGQEQATLIGFHGQTVAHRPPGSGHPAAFTWQIGDAALLARLTGRPVVHDFRSADVAAGGQGAPLAPGYHRARLSGLDRGVGVLNLGGVGNLTWFENPADPGARWGGFDTGPGNALIDDWVAHHGGGRFDAGGRLAAAGKVDEPILQRMEGLQYFRTQGPKSLDRDDFSLAAVAALSPEDGAATLTAFTSRTVALALDNLPVRLTRLFVTGGGRHNPTLMHMIASRTGLPAGPVEELGWNGDALEAEAFAWLAVRHLKGLPLSWPETTGVPAPAGGGRLVRPS
ncbi:anhydro-N-acetylmuramic acid kinase [Sandaracinobacter sp. RS1-74]|uniref:anhydro-N-acetylmuramic acid kinase n=1 Tax=Sandaracinobacteroides sayramensis TaxID=2913411 RepID=UPI001EDC6FAC|nr:anhydro-N-acetylmuramic acid kinase [Sandaracinobacteroides sayramensis]MCG2839381.1 anhydro-N-acetylmuramic acid kinase [Sandaracinobacteroides sayramensis]